MKLNQNLKSIMLAVIFGTVAVSCTNTFDEPNQGLQKPDNNFVNPVRQPEFYAWSGEQSLSDYGYMPYSTRSADAVVNGNFFKIVDFENADRAWLSQQYPVLAQYIENAPEQTDRGEYVSQHEYDVVMAYLHAHPNEGSTVCNLSTYFIQNVGSSKDEYTVDYLTESGSVHHSQKVTGGEHMDYLTINDTHMPDYNATDGKRALVVDVLVNNPTYHDSFGDQDNTKYNAYRYYYIEVDGVMNCYLCFDYQMKKYDNGMCDYTGDKDFSDWVIKLVPGDGNPVIVPDEPVVPETPITPEIPNVTDEVEINLSILDSHDYEFEDLVSKLSIHVRAATDVEVFIPVPAKYYCDADDLNILLTHDPELISYGAESKAEYEIIPGHIVTVTVKFEENGIRVTTDGIDEEIIAYCKETYGDGVNFEIWNYFNNVIETEGFLANAVTREELQGYLNQATVKFLDKIPDAYINAFNDTDENELFEGDCTVKPVDSQINEFDEPYDGWHYNGSEYNQIYINKNVDK